MKVREPLPPIQLNGGYFGCLFTKCIKKTLRNFHLMLKITKCVIFIYGGRDIIGFTFLFQRN